MYSTNKRHVLKIYVKQNVESKPIKLSITNFEYIYCYDDRLTMLRRKSQMLLTTRIYGCLQWLWNTRTNLWQTWEPLKKYGPSQIKVY